MKAIVYLGLIPAFLLQACGTPKAVIRVNSNPTYQRFVPVGSDEKDVALDTRTGELCRTWNWQRENDPRGKIPLCAVLYGQTEFLNRFPDK